jgi:adenosylcobyric acid synthase
MVLGTGSHVGKSLVTAALCRIFARRGYRVSPFKAQNMSLNSAATPEGLEIGRAQALQAEAAGLAASVHMNPVLIKPTGNMTSQVIVQGKIWAQLSASDYHRRRVEELMPYVRESYELLAAKNDVIVLEGAGSPAEINLKDRDIVNMRMAKLADAACILVGDIDRGGVFASLLGTIELLDPEERAQIAGFVINKFRGDLSLLTPGVEMMETRIGKRCLGVLPWLQNLSLEEEDSVGLAKVQQRSVWQNHSESPDRPLRVAIVALPTFSNFTDFDSLQSEPSVEVLFCGSVEACRGADLLILPGSKQTMDDFAWMQAQGLDSFVKEYIASGLVIGICGGMQLMGESIHDPHGVERHGSMQTLGLLPIATTMQAEKTTTPSEGRVIASSLFGAEIDSHLIAGYEIHVGTTEYLEGSIPFSEIVRAGDTKPHLDGCVSQDGRAFGTYLHGIFDVDTFRHHLLRVARRAAGLNDPVMVTEWQSLRHAAMERLADSVESNLDMISIFSMVGLAYGELVRAGVRE